MSPNKILMFLINTPSGNAKIQNKTTGKQMFECFEKRKRGKAAKSKYSRT